MTTPLTQRSARRRLALSLVALSLLVSACPDNDNPGPPPPVNTDMPPPTDDGSGEDLDMGGGESDEGVDTDASMEDTGEDVDQDINVGDLCGNVQEIGMVDTSSGTLTLTGSTEDFSLVSQYTTSCGFGAAPEIGWSLSVDQPVSVATTPDTSIAWALELHEGDCDSSTRLFCDRNDDTAFILEPNKEYVLLAEPIKSERDSLSLELAFTPLICLPVGERTCEGDDVQICSAGGTAFDTKGCASPCTMGACGGDVCDLNPIEVTTLPFEASGTIEGYRDSIDFNAENSCFNPTNVPTEGGEDDPGQPDQDPPEPDAPTGEIRSSGQDIAYVVRGLTAGEKLYVDASAEVGDTADNVIFVLDACDLMSCRVAIDLGDKLDGWIIPEDGDYLVIVDRTIGQPNDFSVKIWTE